MQNKKGYKVGILIIGSLLWDNKPERVDWRNRAFGSDYLDKLIKVNVPIRYGRFSTDRHCPTMVLSSEYAANNNLGTAYILPLKIQNINLDNIMIAAQNLSEAEGKGRDLIKGKSNKWCIILHWLNPDLSVDAKNELQASWINGYCGLLSEDVIQNYRMENENCSIFNSSGELLLPFPEELKSDFDLILMTQTKPRRDLENSDRYGSIEELALAIFNKPEYFIKNQLHGIRTADDTNILAKIRNLNVEKFESNAKSDGCSNVEIEEFIALL